MWIDKAAMLAHAPRRTEALRGVRGLHPGSKRWRRGRFCRSTFQKCLANVLLPVANFVKEGKPEPAIPKFSQETLAEIVGAHSVTRERVHQSISGVGLVNDKYTTSLLNVILHDRRPDGRGSDGK